jgi:hypothetical protein
MPPGPMPGGPIGGRKPGKDGKPEAPLIVELPRQATIAVCEADRDGWATSLGTSVREERSGHCTGKTTYKACQVS